MAVVATTAGAGTEAERAAGVRLAASWGAVEMAAEMATVEVEAAAMAGTAGCRA